MLQIVAVLALFTACWLPSRCGRAVRIAYWSAAALFVGLASAPSFAQQGGFPAVLKALGSIRTAEGMSALDRMKMCGMRIERIPSWTDIAIRDVPEQAIKKDDRMLEVFFTLPRPPGLESDNPDKYRDILARWYVRGGRPIPESGWAENLQNKRAPLDWMQC